MTKKEITVMIWNVLVLLSVTFLYHTTHSAWSFVLLILIAWVETKEKDDRDKT